MREIRYDARDESARDEELAGFRVRFGDDVLVEDLLFPAFYADVDFNDLYWALLGQDMLGPGKTLYDQAVMYIPNLVEYAKYMVEQTDKADGARYGSVSRNQTIFTAKGYLLNCAKTLDLLLSFINTFFTNHISSVDCPDNPQSHARAELANQCLFTKLAWNKIIEQFRTYLASFKLIDSKLLQLDSHRTEIPNLAFQFGTESAIWITGVSDFILSDRLIELNNPFSQSNNPWCPAGDWTTVDDPFKRKLSSYVHARGASRVPARGAASGASRAPAPGAPGARRQQHGGASNDICKFLQKAYIRAEHVHRSHPVQILLRLDTWGKDLFRDLFHMTYQVEDAPTDDDDRSATYTLWTFYTYETFKKVQSQKSFDVSVRLKVENIIYYMQFLNKTTSNFNSYKNNHYKISQEIQHSRLNVLLFLNGDKLTTELNPRFNFGDQDADGFVAFKYGVNTSYLPSGGQGPQQLNTMMIGPLLGIADGRTVFRSGIEQLELKMKNEFIELSTRPLLIMGYGSSGSGKTTCLFGMTGDSQKFIDNNEGLFQRLLDNLPPTTGGLVCDSCYVSCEEYYRYKFATSNGDTHDLVELEEYVRDLEYNYDQEHLMPKDDNTIYKLNKLLDIGLSEDEQPVKKSELHFKLDNSTGKWFDTDSDQEMTARMKAKVEKGERTVSPTMLNIQSSRSHVIMECRFYAKNTQIPNNDSRLHPLYIADFAGVENLPDCDNDAVGETYRIVRDHPDNDYYNQDAANELFSDQFRYHEDNPIYQNQDQRGGRTSRIYVNTDCPDVSEITMLNIKKAFYWVYPPPDALPGASLPKPVDYSDKFNDFNVHDLRFIIDEIKKLKLEDFVDAYIKKMDEILYDPEVRPKNFKKPTDRIRVQIDNYEFSKRKTNHHTIFSNRKFEGFRPPLNYTDYKHTRRYTRVHNVWDMVRLFLRFRQEMLEGRMSCLFQSDNRKDFPQYTREKISVAHLLLKERMENRQTWNLSQTESKFQSWNVVGAVNTHIMRKVMKYIISVYAKRKQLDDYKDAEIERSGDHKKYKANRPDTDSLFNYLLQAMNWEEDRDSKTNKLVSSQVYPTPFRYDLNWENSDFDDLFKTYDRECDAAVRSREHGKAICRFRVAEGRMINLSLEQVREQFATTYNQNSKLGEVRVSEKQSRVLNNHFCGINNDQIIMFDRDPKADRSEPLTLPVTSRVKEILELPELNTFVVGVFSQARIRDNPPFVDYIECSDLIQEFKRLTFSPLQNELLHIQAGADLFEGDGVVEIPPINENVKNGYLKDLDMIKPPPGSSDRLKQARVKDSQSNCINTSVLSHLGNLITKESQINANTSCGTLEFLDQACKQFSTNQTFVFNEKNVCYTLKLPGGGDIPSRQ